MSNNFAVFTIGYSGYLNNADNLINELKKHKINVLIDVRSEPYSAQFNNFNKEPFSKTLEKEGIIYRNYAKQFGAKQQNKAFYSRFDGEKNRIDYSIFTKSEQFIDGVEKLKTMCKMGYNPVIMCSEKDPIDCHRAIMIGNALFNNYGFKVTHIVIDKKDENQKELEKRIKNKIQSELKNKRKLNKLEAKMRDELYSLFALDESYKNDIQNYYKIINSRIGWTYEQITGWNK